jgi:BirA family biotin operon repressor/biotin-[acetyl-CoA-carboxylase] ligase
LQLLGNQILWLNQVDSTNDFALNLISSNLPESGTVVATTNQLKGRGQRGNNWSVNANENVCFSIILTKLSIDVSQQFIMNMAVAVGLRNFIAAELKSENVSIKWPNDILVNGDKIAGILIENTLTGATINNLIVGIGMNINQVDFNSEGYNRKPTSFAMHTQKKYDVKLMLDILLPHINALVIAFFSKNFSKIKAEYHQHLYQHHVFVNYQYQEETLNLKIVEADERGLLCLIDRNGVLIKVNLQELRFLS